MTWTYRSGAPFIGIALVATGCDSKGSSAPAGSGADGYGAKLVGTWEEDGAKKDEAVTMEFKADGSCKLVMGPIDMAGTYKVTKEEGKVVSFDMELKFGGEKDKGKQTFTATFDDADTITMTPTDKPDPKKMKRKK